MKKIPSVLLTLTVFASALGFAGTGARAAGLIVFESASFISSKGIVFIFDAPDFAKKNVKIKDATLYVGSDFYPLHCVYKADEGKIKCDVRGGLTVFAGQTGIIYLNGQILYVVIPAWRSPAGEGSQSLCGEGEVPGAYVHFFGEGDVTVFIPGNTLDEVQQGAEDRFGDSFEILNGIVCGPPDEEGELIG